MQVAWTFCEPSPRTGLCVVVMTPEESTDVEVGKKGRLTKAVGQTAATKKGSKAAGRAKMRQSPEGADHTGEACKEGNANIAEQQQHSIKVRRSKNGGKPAQRGTSESSSGGEPQAAAKPDVVAARSGEQQGSKKVSKAGAGSRAGVQSNPQNSVVKAASARGKNKNEGGVLNKVTKSATRCSRLRTTRDSENTSLAANSP